MRFVWLVLDAVDWVVRGRLYWRRCDRLECSDAPAHVKATALGCRRMGI